MKDHEKRPIRDLFTWLGGALCGAVFLRYGLPLPAQLVPFGVPILALVIGGGAAATAVIAQFVPEFPTREARHRKKIETLEREADALADDLRATLADVDDLAQLAKVPYRPSLGSLEPGRQQTMPVEILDPEAWREREALRAIHDAEAALGIVRRARALMLAQYEDPRGPIRVMFNGQEVKIITNSELLALARNASATDRTVPGTTAKRLEPLAPIETPSDADSPARPYVRQGSEPDKAREG